METSRVECGKTVAGKEGALFISPAQRIYRDTWTWRIAAALPFLTLLGFAAYDFTTTKQWSEWLWGLTIFFGILFGYTWLWAMKRQITIHTEGISYVSLFNSVDLRWDEITETRYGQQEINTGAHMGLIGVLIMALMKSRGGEVMRNLAIVAPLGKIKISSNVGKIEELIRDVLSNVNPRLKADAERAVASGQGAVFGQFTLSNLGVSWKGKESIPYGSLVKCAISNQNLRLKAEGKWLDNVAVNTKKVPNLFVMLDIIEARRSLSNQSAMAATVGGASVSKYI